MRTTSQTWKNIVANGEFDMESVARIYGATGNDTNGVAGSDSRGSYKEYGTITAPVITRSLLSGDALSVGNAIAGQLKFTIMTTDTIPKSAMIVIKGRVKKDSSVSEWLEFGTFWLDHRTVTDNLTDIEAYDAMKKGNQTYADNSQALVWPKTIKVVVQRIAEQMGVAIDSRTTTDVINAEVGNLNIVTKPTDDMSLLDILGNIGGILGGNWIITDENKLRFVSIITPPDETYFIIDEAHRYIKTDQNDYLIWTGNQQEHIDQNPPTGYGICYVPVVIGSLSTAHRYTVSKVTIGYDSDHVFSVGDDTGYEMISTEMNPYANADTAQLLYSRVSGVEYAPFEATGTIYDPATEPGDWIIMGEVYSVIYNETMTLNIGFSADIAAPGRDEMEDEYPYQTFAQKTQFQLESLEERTQSAITQTRTEINAYVKGTTDGMLLNVVSDTLHYLLKDDNGEVSIADSGWSTTLPSSTRGKYLWVYHTYGLSDGSMIDSVPMSYRDGSYNVTNVTSIYYYTDSTTIPAIPSIRPVSTPIEPNKWLLDIPTLETEHKILYTANFYDLGSSRWATSDVQRINANSTLNTRLNSTSIDINKLGVKIDAVETDVDTFERSTTAQFTSMGASITSIENNMVDKTSVRSAFALDPTNITLTAGQDEHGQATGKITFNAGTLEVNATNFTLTPEGVMTCNGANINGVITSTYDTPVNEYKTIISNAVVNCYLNNNLGGIVGYLDYTGTNSFGIEAYGAECVLIDASETTESDTTGSYISVNKNGSIDLWGNVCVRNIATGVLTQTTSGSFYDREGNRIDILNGMIISTLPY